MQVTTLNKIINLFLVGVFADTLLIVTAVYNDKVFLTQPQIDNLKIITDSIGAPSTILTLIFILLSTGIVFGIITDAISNFIFQPLVNKAIENKYLRFILKCNRAYRQYRLTRKKFKQQFALANKYKNLSKEKMLLQTYAAGIFFHTGNKENIEWGVQHFSFHLLSLNYLVIVCFALYPALTIPDTTLDCLRFLVAIFIFAYALFYQAVQKYLYTYEVAYRHCAIVMSEIIHEESKKSEKIGQGTLLTQDSQ